MAFKLFKMYPRIESVVRVMVVLRRKKREGGVGEIG